MALEVGFIGLGTMGQGMARNLAKDFRVTKGESFRLKEFDPGGRVIGERRFLGLLTSKAYAEEAAEVRDAAAKAGVVVLEGFHYVFHPVMQRMLELLDSGEMGDLERVEAVMVIPAPDDDDPRWSLPLAGGAVMDLGCYALHAHRMLAPWGGGEPTLVDARGEARDGKPGVDEWLDADLEFPDGATGSARCNMAGDFERMTCRIVGTRGVATAANFVLPQRDDRIFVATPAGERVEQLGTRPSYTYQLEAFTARLREDEPLPIDADDAVASMQLIDQCYRAAGFEPRPRFTPPET